MKRLICVACALGLLGLAAVAGNPAAADDNEPPSIKEVMQKLHKGAKSPLSQLKAALKSDSPDWSSVQDTTKDFVILGASLAKNEAPKGEQADFEKLADAYFQNSKKMDDAAKQKDLEATRTTFGKVATSCMACHKAHKP